MGVWGEEGLGKLGPDVVCHSVESGTRERERERESGTFRVKPKAMGFNGVRACVRWR